MGFTSLGLFEIIALCVPTAHSHIVSQNQCLVMRNLLQSLFSPIPVLCYLQDLTKTFETGLIQFGMGGMVKMAKSANF